MRIALIHNLDAGEGEYSADDLVRMIEDAGHEVVHRSVEKNFRRVLRRRDVDLVAVAGGDGTVTDVGKALIDRELPMAIIPTGTANNIATSLGIERRPFHWRRAHAFNVAAVSGVRARRQFFESVGVGLFAERLAEEQQTPSAEEGSRGSRLREDRRRLLQLAPKLTAQWWEVTIDGRDVSDHYLLVEAMVIGLIGPNLHLAPSANPADAYLDVVLIREEQRAELLDFLQRHLHRPGTPSPFSKRKAREVRIHGRGEWLHVDDRAFRMRRDVVLAARGGVLRLRK